VTLGGGGGLKGKRQAGPEDALSPEEKIRASPSRALLAGSRGEKIFVGRQECSCRRGGGM